VSNLDLVVQNITLIHEYQERGLFMTRYDKAIADFNDAAREGGLIFVSSSYMMQWVALLGGGMYTVIGGMQVADHVLSLGTFLATLHIFVSFGADPLDHAGCCPKLAACLRPHESAVGHGQAETLGTAPRTD